MKLVREIRDGVLDEDTNISAVLRKAKVLAATLQNEQFTSWVTHELKGYPKLDEVPEYREIFSPVLGNFIDGFGSSINRYQLPVSQMPDYLRADAVRVRFSNPIGEIESLARSGGQDLRHPWPPEAVFVLRKTISISGNYVLIEAYQPIFTPHLEGILEAVRNHLLDFLLALQQIDPSVLDSENALRQLPRDAVSQVFHVNVHGSHNVLATGSAIDQVVGQPFERGDALALMTHLERLGLRASDLEELKDALAKDGHRPSGDLGERVKTWLGKTIVKALDGTWKAAVSSAPEILTKALAAYYGWS
jgi:hypothetical protein